MSGFELFPRDPDDERFRYTLTREWKPWIGSGGTVCYVGYNPSTATDKKDDPTTLMWRYLADANGWSRYVAVNLFPLRSTTPKVAYSWSRTDAARWILDRNLEFVVEQSRAAHVTVVCWGAMVKPHCGWGEAKRMMIALGERAVFCLGLTASGQPIHPMARGRFKIQRDRKFQPWDWRATFGTAHS